MNAPYPGLPSVPFRDVREGGALRHALDANDRARSLRDECLAWFPPPVRALVPMLDGVTRRWLMRSQSPYLVEIATVAAALDFPGVWFLNGSYEWGCTSLAREDSGAPWLLRTLDWPFPGLGRHVEVAHMAGPAGDFLSVTWPGFVGALTGMAPGRFAASINQAPLWRRTRHPWLRGYDILANAVATWSLPHIPPDQLLRHVFETCATFDDARRRLEQTPVARPVIFTLAGCKAGERCVIERTEETFQTRYEDTSAANDWLVKREPWEARVANELMLTCEYAQAGENSRVRREALAAWDGQPSQGHFSWVTPPVLNPCTRIAVEMCAAEGVLRVVGYENVGAAVLPQPVTLPREFAGAMAA